jgi:hypothetical protein
MTTYEWWKSHCMILLSLQEFFITATRFRIWNSIPRQDSSEKSILKMIDFIGIFIRINVDIFIVTYYAKSAEQRSPWYADCRLANKKLRSFHSTMKSITVIIKAKFFQPIVSRVNHILEFKFLSVLAICSSGYSDRVCSWTQYFGSCIMPSIKKYKEFSVSKWRTVRVHNLYYVVENVYHGQMPNIYRASKLYFHAIQSPDE